MVHASPGLVLLLIFSAQRLASTRRLDLDKARKILNAPQAHIERYQNSPVMHHSISDGWKPVLFDAEGTRIVGAAAKSASQSLAKQAAEKGDVQESLQRGEGVDADAARDEAAQSWGVQAADPELEAANPEFEEVVQGVPIQNSNAELEEFKMWLAFFRSEAWVAFLKSEEGVAFGRSDKGGKMSKLDPVNQAIKFLSQASKGRILVHEGQGIYSGPTPWLAFFLEQNGECLPSTCMLWASQRTQRLTSGPHPELKVFEEWVGFFKSEEGGGLSSWEAVEKALDCFVGMRPQHHQEVDQNSQSETLTALGKPSSSHKPASDPPLHQRLWNKLFA